FREHVCCDDGASSELALLRFLLKQQIIDLQIHLHLSETVNLFLRLNQKRLQSIFDIGGGDILPVERSKDAVAVSPCFGRRCLFYHQLEIGSSAQPVSESLCHRCLSLISEVFCDERFCIVKGGIHLLFIFVEELFDFRIRRLFDFGNDLFLNQLRRCFAALFRFCIEKARVDLQVKLKPPHLDHLIVNRL